MIRFQFFPRSHGITKEISQIIYCFQSESDNIKSPDFNLTSNEVLLNHVFKKLISWLKQEKAWIKKSMSQYFLE